MSFAQFHDGFFRNRKVQAAGSLAAWMWAASIGYASEEMTDGFVPATALAMLCPDLDSKPRLKLAARLVEIGLWEAASGGWMIHDYLKWNLSREVILARREANLARVNKHRGNTVRHGEGNARVMHYNARTSAVSNPPPSVSSDPTARDTSYLSSPAPVAASPLPVQPTTKLALDLGEPTKAKRPRAAKPAADPPPFSVGDAFAALAAAAGGRFAPGVERDWTKGVRIAAAKLVRQYPDLAAWRTVGEWLAAGGDRYRNTVGPSWASSGALVDAMVRSREWAANGRGPVTAHAPVVETIDPWAAAAARNGVTL